MIHSLTALFCKDISSELRGKETLALVLCLSLLLSVLTAFGLHTLLLPPDIVREFFAVLIWIIFLFAATVSVGRSFEYEHENGALEGVLLTGVSPVTIYLSKVLSISALIFVGHLSSILLLVLLLDLDIAGLLPSVAVVSLLVVVGYAALATLLAAMTASSRLKNMLLPLVLLPLLLPLFFCAVQITTDMVITGRADYGSVWFSLLLGLDCLYLVLGVNLFEFVVRE